VALVAADVRDVSSCEDELATSIGFFGSRGVTVSHGLTDVNLQEVEMKRAMASVCERSWRWSITPSWVS
jgi:DeoR/GlpR family transcriptional regulator of sugar metabolism